MISLPLQPVAIDGECGIGSSIDAGGVDAQADNAALPGKQAGGIHCEAGIVAIEISFPPVSIPTGVQQHYRSLLDATMGVLPLDDRLCVEQVAGIASRVVAFIDHHCRADKQFGREPVDSDSPGGHMRSHADMRAAVFAEADALQVPRVGLDARHRIERQHWIAGPCRYAGSKRMCEVDNHPRR